MNKTNSHMLRIKELAKLIGISRATIYDWINPKSPRYDPTFPKQVKLGKKSVRWFLHEIEAWLKNRK